MAISVFLSKQGKFIAVVSIVAVGVVAILLTILPRIIGASALRAIVRQGQRTTAQTTLRWSIVLLLVLLVAAARFGLDVVLARCWRGWYCAAGPGASRPDRVPGAQPGAQRRTSFSVADRSSSSSSDARQRLRNMAL